MTPKTADVAGSIESDSGITDRCFDFDDEGAPVVVVSFDSGITDRCFDDKGGAPAVGYFSVENRFGRKSPPQAAARSDFRLSPMWWLEHVP